MAIDFAENLRSEIHPVYRIGNFGKIAFSGKKWQTIKAGCFLTGHPVYQYIENSQKTIA